MMKSLRDEIRLDGGLVGFISSAKQISSEHRSDFIAPCAISLKHTTIYDIIIFREVTMMAEQKYYCAYLKKLIDSGLCYDMQMISGKFIKPSALPDIKIDRAELLKCCNDCKHKE